jgi:hypothetical protein
VISPPADLFCPEKTMNTAAKHRPQPPELRRDLLRLESAIRSRTQIIGRFRNASEAYALIFLQAERFWIQISHFGPECKQAYPGLILLAAYVVVAESSLKSADLLPPACQETADEILESPSNRPPVVSLYDAWGRLSPLLVGLRDQVHQALEGDPNGWFSQGLREILVQILCIVIDLNLAAHAGRGQVVPLSG